MLGIGNMKHQTTPTTPAIVIIRLESSCSPYTLEVTQAQIQAAAAILQPTLTKASDELLRLANTGGGIPKLNVIERDIVGDVLLRKGAKKVQN